MKRILNVISIAFWGTAAFVLVCVCFFPALFMLCLEYVTQKRNQK